MRAISDEELDRRKIVGVNAETVTDVTSTDFPAHWPGEDHSWSIDHFKKNFRVEFHTHKPLDNCFSLIGIDASIANAFRRIMIAEIPTVAIEEVFVFNNTSIIQDEVLAQRLGLIPLQANKDGLRWLKWYHKPDPDADSGGDISDYNTLVMNLDVKCTWQEKGIERARKGETDPNKLYRNANVYAHQLVFELAGRQGEFFSGSDNALRPVNPDILIAKLRPGQGIQIRMHCVKGIGADHAKFSPVAPATYRLLPHIDITRPILGDDARKFARCFPRGVIGLEPVTKEEAAHEGSGYEGHEDEMKAVVKDPMRDTVSRECLRHPEFEGKVKLGRIRDHFIFSVESTGQWDSDELFLESVRILKQKCQTMKRSLDNLMN
ncbi:putative DNA-directed RNA polymerase I and III subunit Rpc40 [Lineolata rhizophorae]|uniref:DNA-directed RNA polymerases I and III subunit RPAC1 n=1 Tax=Lineolata rhizophorae TaxID=578093 RepID=A0A6A6P7V0_9PEZI|nr:putative DNA-directed RNA polymerase I and III subunit Rpc40 [Lineolata rhizophorae]